MISRRAALRVLAIAPAAAGTAILQGQAAPSEAAAPAERDLLQFVPHGVPVVFHNGRLVWGAPDPARDEIHLGFRWPECWVIEIKSPYPRWRLFKGVPCA